jgi:acetyl esterase/lipase
MQYHNPYSLGCSICVMQDAQRALGILRSNATAWNINASAIGVIGFSAGGSLAAFASTHWRTRLYEPNDVSDSHSSRPDFLIMAYPAPLMADPQILHELLPGLDM